MHLTEKAVTALKAGTKREQYPDDQTTGFGCRVEPNGRKSFYWFAKVHGKPRFRALGEFPSTSVGSARSAAQEFAGQAAKWKRAGYALPDPFEKEKPTADANAPTFSELLNAYVENHVRATANNPAKAEKELRWMAGKYFSGWLARPIDQIGVEEVLSIRNEVGKTRRYMANRIVQTVKLLWNWSAGKKDGRVNFWPAVNPAGDVELYDEKKRERFLQPDELVRFRDELKSDATHPDLRDFVLLALATGARKQTLWGMRWQDISFELRSWAIPFSKSGEGYTASLTDAAVKVLERRRKEISGEFVFPADNETGHVRGGLERQWDNFRKRCGLPDVRIHDLRRTCGSYQAISGVSLQTIGANLGHRSMRSTEIYARLHAQALADARESGESKMAEMEKAARKRLAANPKLLKSA
jgi:integrase